MFLVLFNAGHVMWCPFISCDTTAINFVYFLYQNGFDLGIHCGNNCCQEFSNKAFGIPGIGFGFNVFTNLLNILLLTVDSDTKSWIIQSANEVVIVKILCAQYLAIGFVWSFRMAFSKVNYREKKLKQNMNQHGSGLFVDSSRHYNVL